MTMNDNMVYGAYTQHIWQTYNTYVCYIIILQCSDTKQMPRSCPRYAIVLASANDSLRAILSGC